MKTTAPWKLTLLATGCLVACSSGGGGGGGDSTPDVDGPTLESEDAPNTAPCPEQDVLTDSASLADFQTALQQGSFLYLDVPFSGTDPDIYKKKCGYEAFWDPSDNTDEIAPNGNYSDPPVVAEFFVFGNAGICAANYSTNFQSGFPEAGVYRKEFKVSFSGTTYHARVRVTVSGNAAGETFAQHMISVPSDLENTLGYEVAGSAVTHDGILPAIANALSAPNASTTIEIFDGPGGNSLMSAEIEFICVAIL